MIAYPYTRILKDLQDIFSFYNYTHIYKYTSIVKSHIFALDVSTYELTILWCKTAHNSKSLSWLLLGIYLIYGLVTYLHYENSWAYYATDSLGDVKLNQSLFICFAMLNNIWNINCRKVCHVILY